MTRLSLYKQFVCQLLTFKLIKVQYFVKGILQHVIINVVVNGLLTMSERRESWHSFVVLQMYIYYNTIFGFIALVCVALRTIFTRDSDHRPMFTENM